MTTPVTRRSALALLGLASLSLTGCASSARRGAASRPSATTSPGIPMQTVAYGTDRSQFAELHLPAGDAEALPVVVVVHGGFWGAEYGLDLGTPLAQDLARHGVAAWNIEYRRLGNGGGWPHTFLDVAGAMDALPAKGNAAAGGRLDLSRVAVVGHSAGGHLAAWLAARHKLEAGAVGASPAVNPIGYVSQAGVLDLVDGYRTNLDGGAVRALMGGSPTQHPDRYANGSPYELLPVGVPGTLVHGLADTTVPIEQSDRYATRAKTGGDTVTELRLPGVDHFMLIDPTSAAWARCRSAALGYITGK